MRRAPTTSPMRLAKLGATSDIFSFKYVCKDFLYAKIEIVRSAKLMTFVRSIGEMSLPMLARPASMTFFARIESSSSISVKLDSSSSSRSLSRSTFLS